MKNHTVDLAADTRCVLGEGPVWWQGGLWFVDIESRRVHRLEPDSGRVEAFDVPGRVGFAWPTSGGDWLIGQDALSARWSPERGAPEVVLDVEPSDAGVRLNDGACDPTGRLYAGTMHLDAAAQVGALFRFDATGGSLQAERVVRGVTISNGLAWDESRQTMYYIDTPTRRIDAFDWDADSGEILNRRPVVARDHGVPDGLCIVRDGALWVAMWGGSRVAKVDPIAGREVGSIPLPCAHVTSCCFGGGALDRLWITTARVGLDAISLEAQPRAGGVFVADVGAAGFETSPARL